MGLTLNDVIQFNFAPIFNMVIMLLNNKITHTVISKLITLFYLFFLHDSNVIYVIPFYSFQVYIETSDFVGSNPKLEFTFSGRNLRRWQIKVSYIGCFDPNRYKKFVATSVFSMQIQSNQCKTNTLETQKLWSLLTDGRCSEAIHVIKFPNGTSK